MLKKIKAFVEPLERLLTTHGVRGPQKSTSLNTTCNSQLSHSTKQCADLQKQLVESNFSLINAQENSKLYNFIEQNFGLFNNKFNYFSKPVPVASWNSNQLHIQNRIGLFHNPVSLCPIGLKNVFVANSSRKFSTIHTTSMVNNATNCGGNAMFYLGFKPFFNLFNKPDSLFSKYNLNNNLDQKIENKNANSLKKNEFKFHEKSIGRKLFDQSDKATLNIDKRIKISNNSSKSIDYTTRNIQYYMTFVISSPPPLWSLNSMATSISNISNISDTSLFHKKPPDIQQLNDLIVEGLRENSELYYNHMKEITSILEKLLQHENYEIKIFGYELRVNFPCGMQIEEIENLLKSLGINPTNPHFELEMINFEDMRKEIIEDDELASYRQDALITGPSTDKHFVTIAGVPPIFGPASTTSTTTNVNKQLFGGFPTSTTATPFAFVSSGLSSNASTTSSNATDKPTSFGRFNFPGASTTTSTTTNVPALSFGASTSQLTTKPTSTGTGLTSFGGSTPGSNFPAVNASNNFGSTFQTGTFGSGSLSSNVGGPTNTTTGSSGLFTLGGGGEISNVSSTPTTSSSGFSFGGSNFSTNSTSATTGSSGFTLGNAGGFSTLQKSTFGNFTTTGTIVPTTTTATTTNAPSAFSGLIKPAETAAPTAASTAASTQNFFSGFKPNIGGFGQTANVSTAATGSTTTPQPLSFNTSGFNANKGKDSILGGFGANTKSTFPTSSLSTNTSTPTTTAPPKFPLFGITTPTSTTTAAADTNVIKSASQSSSTNTTNAPASNNTTTTAAPSMFSGLSTPKTQGQSLFSRIGAPNTLNISKDTTETPKTASTTPTSLFPSFSATTKPLTTPSTPSTSATRFSIPSTTKPSIPSINSTTTTATTTPSIKLSTPVTTSTTIPSLLSTTTTSTTKPTTTTASTSLSIPSTTKTATDQIPAWLKNNNIEGIIDKWTKDLDNCTKKFNGQVKEVHQLDQRVMLLNDKINEAKIIQNEINAFLDETDNKQKVLEKVLDDFEKLFDESIWENMNPFDKEREETYKITEYVNQNLDIMSQDLFTLINEINTNQSSSSTKVGKILNSHLISLQWIDSSANQLSSLIQEAQSYFEKTVY
ncbi:14507_t:CDS:10 [Entrophospora sp. SA101]|nr:14507_t:CDS:10 [Entrophospora sp. SA101]